MGSRRQESNEPQRSKRLPRSKKPAGSAHPRCPGEAGLPDGPEPASKSPGRGTSKA